ncbi:tyrosine-type recombinase/integrase [Neptuniibacter halophilus]|uniref:tyrosine-type recombinase/integrase n=1 Tax=Neptuniibacter halophilus TaxID=651666 RepID=UPI003305B831
MSESAEWRLIGKQFEAKAPPARIWRDSHSGRRSYATNLIMIQGVDLDIVSTLLGHSDPSHAAIYRDPT